VYEGFSLFYRYLPFGFKGLNRAVYEGFPLFYRDTNGAEMEKRWWKSWPQLIYCFVVSGTVCCILKRNLFRKYDQNASESFHIMGSYPNRFQVLAATSMKMAVFWDVDRRFWGCWRQKAPQKLWPVSTRVQGATSQKATAFVCWNCNAMLGLYWRGQKFVYGKAVCMSNWTSLSYNVPYFH
jgi:hypothetical protein